MSKGLEALEELLYYANLNFERENERKTEFSNKIEKMGIDDNEENFKIIEKDLEVLEIIKNKRLSVNTLIVSIIGAKNPLEFYNEEVSSKLKLTQQEFDLLKEWLENE